MGWFVGLVCFVCVCGMKDVRFSATSRDRESLSVFL